MKKGITIGMDLGDKKHQACIISSAGKIIAEEEVAGNRTAVATFFKQYGGGVAAMETGTHFRWISPVAEREGLKVLVGNARISRDGTLDQSRRRWTVGGAGLLLHALWRTGKECEPKRKKLLAA